MKYYIIAIFTFIFSIYLNNNILKLLLEIITSIILLRDNFKSIYENKKTHKLDFLSIIDIIICIIFFIFNIEKLFLLCEIIKKILLTVKKNNNINYLKLENIKNKKIIIIINILLMIILFFITKSLKRVILFLCTIIFIYKEINIEILINKIYEVSYEKIKEKNIIFNSDNVFSALAKCNEIILSKTGVLTNNEMTLEKIIPVYKTKEEILKYATILEKNSIHPMARAIKKLEYKYECDNISFIKELKGKGIRGVIDNVEVVIGSSILFEELNIKYPKVEILDPNCMIAIDGTYVGTFVFKNEVKKDLEFLFPLLKEKGISKTILISSSSKIQIKKIITHLSISECYANLTLEEKIEFLKNEKRSNYIMYIDDIYLSNKLITSTNISVSMTKNKNCDIELLNSDLNSLLYIINEAKYLLKIKKIIIKSYIIITILNYLLLFLNYQNLFYIVSIILIYHLIFIYFLKCHKKGL